MKKLSLFALITLFLLIATDDGALCSGSEHMTVLAEVKGEIIDERELQDAINAIHKSRPLMRPDEEAGGINILGLLQRMIDERLMIQEAYRVEFDKDPDFEKKLQSSIANQSINRLRKEVVLYKIDISEEDLLDYFKKHYKKDGPVLEEEFQKRKGQIRRKLRREKEKELSDSFVAMLRKQSDIWIDGELLGLLDPEKHHTTKKSIIARVNGDPIPLNDMLHDMRRAFQKREKMYSRLKDNSEQEKLREELKQQTLYALITYKLIEQEALRRNYLSDPVFMEIIRKRKERLLVNAFQEKTIYPLAIPTKKELTKYYEEHIDNFRKGYQVWFSEMIFRAREDAEKALKELKEGANFEYLATHVSERWPPKRARVWVNTDKFSPGIRQELNRLEVGQTSDVLADGRQYKIIKLKGKRGGAPEEFSRVADTLRKKVVQQKFNAVLSDYLAKLRKESNIKINRKALNRIEEKYKAKPTEEAKTKNPNN